MLKNTFCHLPGIGILKEKRFWDSGIYSWEDLLRAPASFSPNQRTRDLTRLIERSVEELERNNPRFFADFLPSNQQWRLFPSFRNSIAYLDIETTGLDFGESITTIALYDGSSLFHYVNGHNLDEFKKQIRQYEVIVTYNGKCFDVPFIERYFRMRLDHAHIDLRYVLHSLGYSGGLKGCERKLGIDRKELEGVDGFFAVLLWHDYKRNHNEKALETLLAYNVEDVLNLEKLLVFAYNIKLKDTPFHSSHRIESLPDRPNPFRADLRTIRGIRNQEYGEW